MGTGGEGPTVARFTRRTTPSLAEHPEWLVLVGDDCREYWVQMCIPDEEAIRRRLHIRDDVPVLIGRA